jgi:hypothetical protein
MTRFKPGDRVKIARREGSPIGAVVVGHDDTHQTPSGRVVLRAIVEFDDGSRTLLIEDAPWITLDIFGEVDPVPVTAAADDHVTWRSGTDPLEIAELLTQYLNDNPDLAEELSVSTEAKLSELPDDLPPEQTLEILSESADELLARLRKDPASTREVRAGDLVLGETPPAKPDRERRPGDLVLDDTPSAMGPLGLELPWKSD